MFSKNLQKLIRSLEQKKYRSLHGLFVAEGPKVVGDLMRHVAPRTVLATSEWQGPVDGDFEFVALTADELSRVSLLKAPQQVLALFPLPEPCPTSDFGAAHRLVIALDGVQDPGNLGTIIRVADWFGVADIVCSHDTADAFNPKVVQATMGSLGRVRVSYADLSAVLSGRDEAVAVYGTALDGNDIYTTPLGHSGFIVMGNEGRGISPEVQRTLTHRLLIPRFGTGDGPDSLNVATATAIVCSEFMRRA